MTPDEQKTKAELLQELDALRRCASEFEQFEEELKHSNKQFKELLENTIVGVYRTTSDGRIIMANPTLVRMLGYSSFEEFSQRNLEKEGFAPQYPRSIFKNLIEREGKVVGLESAWLRRDRTPLFVIENARVVRDESGKTLYYEGIVQDITERKRCEEMLRESEEKFRLAMEATNDALWDWNMVTNEVYRNACHATMLGYEPHELSASQNEWEKRIHPNDRQFLLEITSELLTRKRESFEIEYRLRTKSGDYIWVLGRGKVVAYSDDGSPARMIGTNIDITARKKAEEEIKKFQKMADNAPYGCAMSDLDGNLTYINDSLAKMHGYTPDELIGKNLEIFHNDAQIKRVKELNQELVETGQGLDDEEVWHTHRDGTEFPTLMSNWIIKDNNGNPITMCATAIDITKRKKAENNLTIFREKMARTERLASLGALSATVAHEFAQPLTIARLLIENSLEKLKEISSTDIVARKLKDSLTELSNVKLIVERFKNYARLSSGGLVREIDLKLVAERIVNFLNESALRSRVALCIGRMDKLPLIYSNEKDIEQLFFALIDNAIQSADNKRNRQLVINSAVKDGHIELQFSDNCGGIPPENLDKIFEPFFTTRPEGKGTGLGLSIVQRIVSKMSGKVWVESEPGKGSSFFVALPRISKIVRDK